MMWIIESQENSNQILGVYLRIKKILGPYQKCRCDQEDLFVIESSNLREQSLEGRI